MLDQVGAHVFNISPCFDDLRVPLVLSWPLLVLFWALLGSPGALLVLFWRNLPFAVPAVRRSPLPSAIPPPFARRRSPFLPPFAPLPPPIAVPAAVRRSRRRSPVAVRALITSGHVWPPAAPPAGTPLNPTCVGDDGAIANNKHDQLVSTGNRATPWRWGGELSPTKHDKLGSHRVPSHPEGVYNP